VYGVNSEHTFQVTRISNPLLPTLNPPTLSFHSYTPRMTLLRQYSRLLQILSFIIMRHVHHHAVHRQFRDNRPDVLDILRVVDVQ
jgi:hypothetical protein